MARTWWAPYDLQGTQSDSRWDGYEMSWDYVSQYGSSGIWTSSGSGTGQGAVGDRTDRSASGAVAHGSVTGTYDEGSNTYNNFGYDLTLDMTNWQWTMGGSGSGIGNGGSHKNLDLQDSNWSASAHGGNVVGTGSETLDESFGYSFDYQAHLGSGNTGWIVSGGSGSGAGAGSARREGSGTGTYAASFDSGAGTISGTNSVALHDAWQYGFQQDYTYASGAWATTEVGSGTTDGAFHSEYSGSGSYSSSGTTSNGTTSASGGGGKGDILLFRSEMNG